MIKKPQQRHATFSPALACARWSVIGLAAIAAVGCSVLDEEKVDYRSARKASTLEVPPDLTQLSRDARYAAPGASVTASSLQVQQTRAAEPAAPVKSDLRIERAGSQRWLVVDRAPEKLWEPLKSFWQDSGFNLAIEQQNLGIMETDWAENRAKLPQDIIRSTIGKVFDSFYSTAERDKFRTRIERNAQGGSEIYISHRGMIEVYSNDRKDQTVWQPRASDVELEAEFLRRLMLKLGTTPEQAKAVLAAAGSQPSASKLATVNGQSALQIAEGFDRAWRRVGLALDRTGFTVEDRDRSQGIYFVRYLPSAVQGEEKPGFFASLFGAKNKETGPQRYRVKVSSAGSQSTVSVLDAQGQADASPHGRKILQLLADDLK